MNVDSEQAGFLASLDTFLAQMKPQDLPPANNFPMSLEECCAVDQADVVQDLLEALKLCAKDVLKFLEGQCEAFKKKAKAFDDALSRFQKTVLP